MTVGSQRNVDRPPVQVAQLCQIPHKFDDTSSQQRLASGNPDLFDPRSDQNSSHAQVIGEWEVGVHSPVVACAAVDTTVVAAVGDGDAQVGDRSSEFVAQLHEISYPLPFQSRMFLFRNFLFPESR